MDSNHIPRTDHRVHRWLVNGPISVTGHSLSAPNYSTLAYRLTQVANMSQKGLTSYCSPADRHGHPLPACARLLWADIAASHLSCAQIAYLVGNMHSRVQHITWWLFETAQPSRPRTENRTWDYDTEVSKLLVPSYSTLVWRLRFYRSGRDCLHVRRGLFLRDHCVGRNSQIACPIVYLARMNSAMWHVTSSPMFWLSWIKNIGPLLQKNARAVTMQAWATRSQ